MLQLLQTGDVFQSRAFDAVAVLKLQHLELRAVFQRFDRRFRKLRHLAEVDLFELRQFGQQFHAFVRDLAFLQLDDSQALHLRQVHGALMSGLCESQVDVDQVFKTSQVSDPLVRDRSPSQPQRLKLLDSADRLQAFVADQRAGRIDMVEAGMIQQVLHAGIREVRAVNDDPPQRRQLFDDRQVVVAGFRLSEISQRHATVRKCQLDPLFLEACHRGGVIIGERDSAGIFL